ncbi:hypothetical protein SADUNF_Sadunf19G0057500 [Salix dunnii]|uniref:Uncharacterized protein n=1 Tax=Salix dunnii TaxID=1413687 RepID=A0A835J1F4_9ROSI|nr:hypothetical protein SADUNF_Sadunf19G0057500 [Salix dunnii]
MMLSHEFVVPTNVALVTTTLIAKILPPHFVVNDKKFKKYNGFNFKRWKHKILFVKIFSKTSKNKFNVDVAIMKKFIIIKFLDFNMFHSRNIISEVQEFQLTLHDTFHGMHNIK